MTAITRGFTTHVSQSYDDNHVNVGTALYNGSTLVYAPVFAAVLSADNTLADLRADIYGQISAYVVGMGDTIDMGVMVDAALNNLSFTPADSAISLSVQTSTGAVGTQVSTTQDAWVAVNGSVSTTATIGGSSAGDLVVEVAPTNSATPGDWVEKGRIGNSQTITLAIALNSVQVIKSQMMAFVPKGYYVKVRSVTASGTPTYAIGSARKVLV